MVLLDLLSRPRGAVCPPLDPPAYAAGSRYFVQNFRPPSYVSRWGSKGAEPLSSSGRVSKGDRLEIGPLWRFLSPLSVPEKKVGRRRQTNIENGEVLT